MAQYGKVLILAGGETNPQRVMSTETVTSVKESLQRQKIAYTEYDLMYKRMIKRTFPDFIKAQKPDVVFNCLHGGYGEDGYIQQVLEDLVVPYTHSGPIISERANRKTTCLMIASSEKIPTTRFGAVYPKSNDAPELPLMVKNINKNFEPSIEIETAEDWSTKVENDPDLYWEEYVVGVELMAYVIRDKTTLVLDMTHNEVANINEDAAIAIKKYASQIHWKLEAEQISCSKFIYDHASDEIHYLETYLQPSLASSDLLTSALASIDMTYDSMVKWMLDSAKVGRT